MIEIKNSVEFNQRTKAYKSPSEATVIEEEKIVENIDPKLLVELSESAKKLHKIDLQFQQIKSIDKQKVALLAAKVQNEQLNIQGSYEKKMQSAKIIAEKLIENMILL